jgi:hypothetical protein
MCTAIDFAFADPCRGDVLGGSQRLIAAARPQLTDIVMASVARVEASDNEGTNEPARQPSNDDDCFCCCSHVLPGTVTTTLGVTELRSPGISLEYLAVPSTPLAPAFPPPRSA